MERVATHALHVQNVAGGPDQAEHARWHCLGAAGDDARDCANALMDPGVDRAREGVAVSGASERLTLVPLPLVDDSPLLRDDPGPQLRRLAVAADDLLGLANAGQRPRSVAGPDGVERIRRTRGVEAESRAARDDPLTAGDLVLQVDPAHPEPVVLGRCRLCRALLSL